MKISTKITREVPSQEYPGEMETQYQVDAETWVDDRLLCHHCMDDEEGPYREAYTQYSFGIYAGKYCETCWPKSGYRDATDENAEFDPTYAGECLESDDY